MKLLGKYPIGISFRIEGVDIYDNSRHLGRLLRGSRKIALYNEARAAMSTRYRNMLVEFVKKECRWHTCEVIWF